jgi:hypothetical protein
MTACVSTQPQSTTPCSPCIIIALVTQRSTPLWWAQFIMPFQVSLSTVTNSTAPSAPPPLPNPPAATSLPAP